MFQNRLLTNNLYDTKWTYIPYENLKNASYCYTYSAMRFTDQLKEISPCPFVILGWVLEFLKCHLTELSS